MTYRSGKFSSSSAHLLIPEGSIKMTEEELKVHKAEFPSSKVTTKKGGFQASGLTYIKEKNLERKLNRQLDLDTYSRSSTWGNVFEKVCAEKLPLYYELVSNNGVGHKEYSDFWVGTPDILVEGVLIGEIKCYQLKKFAEYTQMLMDKNLDAFKADFAQEYWQIVSNAIINDVDFGEAISFMPYRSTLELFREELTESNFIERYGFEPWQVRFIIEEKIENLAYIDYGGYFNELTTFKFEIPKEDKELLTRRMLEASTQLIKI